MPCRPVRSHSRLIKWQLWGEVVYHNSGWGFTTNGHLFLPFVRTGRKELTLGSLMEWTSPDLVATLAGLCFASIDEFHPQRGEELRRYLTYDRTTPGAAHMFGHHLVGANPPPGMGGEGREGGEGGEGGEGEEDEHNYSDED